jgi:hypothetical protein
MPAHRTPTTLLATNVQPKGESNEDHVMVAVSLRGP